MRYSLKNGVLSKVFEVLAMHNITVHEMENKVFKDRMAAVAMMKVKTPEDVDCNEVDA